MMQLWTLTAPRPLQREVIVTALDGQDVFVQAVCRAFLHLLAVQWAVLIWDFRQHPSEKACVFNSQLSLIMEVSLSL